MSDANMGVHETDSLTRHISAARFSIGTSVDEDVPSVVENEDERRACLEVVTSADAWLRARTRATLLGEVIDPDTIPRCPVSPADVSIVGSFDIPHRGGMSDELFKLACHEGIRASLPTTFLEADGARSSSISMDEADTRIMLSSGKCIAFVDNRSEPRHTKMRHRVCNVMECVSTTMFPESVKKTDISFEDFVGNVEHSIEDVSVTHDFWNKLRDQPMKDVWASAPYTTHIASVARWLVKCLLEPLRAVGDAHRLHLRQLRSHVANSTATLCAAVDVLCQHVDCVRSYTRTNGLHTWPTIEDCRVETLMQQLQDEIDSLSHENEGTIRTAFNIVIDMEGAAATSRGAGGTE